MTEDKKENTKEDIQEDAKEVSCPLCIEDFSEDCMIKCLKCSFTTCKKCTETHLMSLISLETPCMNCKAQWDYAFLHDILDEKFFNKYQLKKATLLQEREKSLLPETQQIVQEEKELEIIKTGALNINNILKELRKVASLNIECVSTLVGQRIAQLSNIYYKLLDKMSPFNRRKKEDKPKKTFFGHCPNSECKGYLVEDIQEPAEEVEDEDEAEDNKIENKAENKSKPKKKVYPLKCPLCSVIACRKCRIAKHKGKCNEDLVKDIRSLEKETKPCPSCHTRIFKIDGCDQMFCTNCHTPFSWKSGEIETGKIHNPHYYEYMRRTGKQIAREPDQCGAVDMYRLSGTLSRCFSNWRDIDAYHRKLSHIHQRVTHINQENLPNYNGEIDGLSNRKKYLKNELTEKQWIFNLKRKLKDSYKNKAIRDVLTMLYAVTNDIFALLLESNSIQEIDSFIQQLEALRVYANDTFVKIGKLLSHNKLIPIITENWDFKSSRTVKNRGRKPKAKPSENDDTLSTGLSTGSSYLSDENLSVRSGRSKVSVA